jgi:hypothetical protein
MFPYRIPREFIVIKFSIKTFLRFKFRSLVTATYHSTLVIDTDRVLAFMLMTCCFEIIFLIAYYDRVIYAHVLVNVAQVVYCITSFQADNFSLRRQF